MLSVSQEEIYYVGSLVGIIVFFEQVRSSHGVHHMCPFFFSPVFSRQRIVEDSTYPTCVVFAPLKVACQPKETVSVPTQHLGLEH